MNKIQIPLPKSGRKDLIEVELVDAGGNRHFLRIDAEESEDYTMLGIHIHRAKSSTVSYLCSLRSKSPGTTGTNPE